MTFYSLDDTLTWIDFFYFS